MISDNISATMVSVHFPNIAYKYWYYLSNQISMFIIGQIHT